MKDEPEPLEVWDEITDWTAIRPSGRWIDRKDTHLSLSSGGHLFYIHKGGL